MKLLELNLPRALIGDVSEADLKLYLAIMLYKERKLGQAAKLAGLKLRDFMYELGKHKESFTNISAEELEEELRQIK